MDEFEPKPIFIRMLKKLWLLRMRVTRARVTMSHLNRSVNEWTFKINSK